MNAPIYLDHMASTPLDPRVREAMLPWLEAGAAGNPHSMHRAGWRAAEAIQRARGEIAALIGAAPGEIVVTSGATEANNLALFGGSRAGGVVLVSAIEHPSILACLPALERHGRMTRTVPVTPDGHLDLDALAAALTDTQGRDVLVSVMVANHEIGTLQPLDGVGALTRKSGGRLHSDATQGLSSQALDVRSLDLDLLSLSGHKLYGPQGIGVLWVRDGLRLEPLFFGGGQQGGLRPGTLPVAPIVGLGEACRIDREERAHDAGRLARLTARLWQDVREIWPAAIRNGGRPQLPHCLSVTLPGVDAEDLLLDLPDLCVSTGSACATAEPGPSPVLLAIGRSAEAAHGTIRFGLGRFTTQEQIDCVLTRLGSALGERRGASLARA